MRKVTLSAVTAFMQGVPHGQGNTTVRVSNGVIELYLFDNLIAKKEKGKTYITNAGWFSNTTKERLNGLPNVNIKQVDGTWYLNGKMWDGKLTEV